MGRYLKPLPCFGPRCRNTRPHWFFFCAECWERIPGWLQRAIAVEKGKCKAARIAHSQALLGLRDRAYSELNKGATP